VGRATSTVVVMQPTRRARPLTIVCQLMAEPAAEGRFVGNVEDVDTGDVAAVASVEELLALLVRLSAGREP
jgi:hypothetical protein